MTDIDMETVADMQVHAAKSLEQAIELERAQGRFYWSTLLMRAWVRGYVIFCNALLSVMERLIFREKCPDPQAIIVYTVGTLGDNVLMLSAVAAIRQRYPEATLTVVTNCDGFGSYTASQVWGQSEYVDHFVALPNHPVQRVGFRLNIHKPGLEQTRCDLFVNLSPFGNRGRLGAVVREMIFARSLGARQATGFWLNSYNRRGALNRVQHYFVKNEARRPREVLKRLGIAPLEKLDLLPLVETARENLNKLLRESGVEPGCTPLVLLNPGSKLAASQWPPERFGEFAKWVAGKYGAQVLVNGTEAERGICDEVVRVSGGKAISLAGKLPIQELIELLRMASACVSNNTGTMTLAAMTMTPLIVLASTRFSPTFFMPVSEKMIWLFSFSECSYSYNDTGGASEDMLNIRVADLIAAFERLPGQEAHGENKK